MAIVSCRGKAKCIKHPSRSKLAHNEHHSGYQWLPRSLYLLFAGRKKVDAEVQQQQNRRQVAYTEEARLMKLLADKEADEVAVPDCVYFSHG